MITKDSKNILVADDSVFFRTRLSEILVEAGHRVTFANDGKEVIDEIRINAAGIDLLTLDLQMPRVDGYGVLEWINENGFRGRFPIIVVTGVHEPSEVLDRVRNLGATGFMTKAFTPEQTVFRVNQMLFPEKELTAVERKRVPVSIAVDYSTDGLVHTGFILNISSDGIFLHTNDHLAEGTKVDLQFSLPGQHGLIEATGVVRWIANSEKTEGIFRGYGISFDRLAEGDQDLLAQFVDNEYDRLELHIEPQAR